MRKALLHLKKCDPVLANIIERVGPYRMDHTEPDFQSLARSIVYQQLSGKAAGTIYGRLIAASSDPLTPAGILRLSPEEMRALGLSQQKSAYLRDLAERTATAEINFERLAGLTDDEIIQQLT
ncbi:MAG TPA: hypothetical protein VMZ52_06505 [Bryobacteraceae bacterium]|nr:hypothetical protein [Bryobacteraceae bacterium]